MYIQRVHIETGSIIVMSAFDALDDIYAMGVLIPERKIQADWDTGKSLLYRPYTYTPLDKAEEGLFTVL